MMQSFMGDKQCWMEHMALNSTDGLDPEGIRLRASEGLLGVDYFFPGYAVWAGLIEAAADLGYDTNNLVRGISSADHACSSPMGRSARSAPCILHHTRWLLLEPTWLLFKLQREGEAARRCC